jgi:hypothetical protein
MPLTALAEPLYQLYFMNISGDYPLYLMVIIGFHILYINLFQMYLWRRYGFFHMLTFRICYYLAWHIIWGALRSQLLFG